MFRALGGKFEGMATGAERTRRSRRRKAALQSRRARKRSRVIEVGDQIGFLSVSERAIHHVVQWWAGDQEDKRLQEEMQKARMNMKQDLRAAKEEIETENWVMHMSCGVDAQRKHVIEVADEEEKARVGRVLNDRLYQNGGAELSQKALICKKCLSEIKKERIPRTALCKGWNFDEKIPEELASLNSSEALLISLRLPSTPVWRVKGGSGQKASSGCAISYSNPVADLCKKLP